MKIKKSYLFYFLFALFMLYGVNSTLFERMFFTNEFLSASGFLILIYKLFLVPEKSMIRLPKSEIFRWIVALQLLCIYHLMFSVFFKTNWYFYLRNSVIFYSIFSFYLGFYYLPYFLSFIEKTKYIFIAYLIFGLVWPAEYLLDRFTTAAFFPYFFKKMNWQAASIIMILNLVLAKQYESMTVVLITVLLAVIYILWSYRMFKGFVLCSSVAIFLIFIYFIPNFEKYQEDEYTLFGNTHAVMYSDPLLSIDGNSTWRAVFWYRIIKERFPENIMGIGFGTPLLKYNYGSNTVISGHDDYYDIHVTGAHNTYLTLALRLGIYFLIIMGFIFRRVFYEFYTYKKEYSQSEAGLIFLSFFSIAIIGLFNLLLESPMTASIFWGLLGLVAALIERRKKLLIDEASQ